MKGIWAAALVPFNDDLTIDEKSFRRNLRHWVDDLEIDGIFVAGKQSEFFSMSIEERKRIVEITIDEVGKQAGVIASCSDQNMDTVIELARHAQVASTPYIVVHAPVLHFLTARDETLYEYYKTISEHVDVGIAMWSHEGLWLFDKSRTVCTNCRSADSSPSNTVCHVRCMPNSLVLSATRSSEHGFRGEWLDNIVELNWKLYLCSSPPYLYQTKNDRRMREYTDLAFKGDVAKAKTVREASSRCGRRFEPRARRKSRRHIRNIGKSCLVRPEDACAPQCLNSPTRKGRLRDAPSQTADFNKKFLHGHPSHNQEFKMQTGGLKAFNFQNWISENQHLLKPPVGNMKVFEVGEMTVQVVGGPNERADYHDDPVEEFFYQLRGDMVLKVVDDGNFYDIPIREGDVFLLPPHVRHSPQRPQAGSVGLVVEPKRYPDDPLDGFEWFCFECHALVHRIELKVEHLVRDLPPLYEAFFNDEKARTCKACGAVHPGKKPPAGWVKLA